MKRICTHPNRLARRQNALARFRIQTETEWNDGIKGSKQVSGTYSDYLARKEVERLALIART